MASSCSLITSALLDYSFGSSRPIHTKDGKAKLEEFQERGAGPDEIPDEIKAALMGPIFARGAIIDVPCDAGLVKPEAKAALGTDKLMQMAKKYYNRQRKSNGP